MVLPAQTNKKTVDARTDAPGRTTRYSHKEVQVRKERLPGACSHLLFNPSIKSLRSSSTKGLANKHQPERSMFGLSQFGSPRRMDLHLLNGLCSLVEPTACTKSTSRFTKNDVPDPQSSTTISERSVTATIMHCTALWKSPVFAGSARMPTHHANQIKEVVSLRTTIIQVGSQGYTSRFLQIPFSPEFRSRNSWPQRNDRCDPRPPGTPYMALRPVLSFARLGPKRTDQGRPLFASEVKYIVI